MRAKTVGQLRELLKDIPNDTPLYLTIKVYDYLMHDRGNGRYDYCYTRSANDGNTYGCCSQAGLDNTTMTQVIAVRE